VELILWVVALTLFLAIPMPPKQTIITGRLLIITFIILLIASLAGKLQ
jgi:hypothetical protein